MCLVGCIISPASHPANPQCNTQFIYMYKIYFELSLRVSQLLPPFDVRRKTFLTFCRRENIISRLPYGLMMVYGNLAVRQRQFVLLSDNQACKLVQELAGNGNWGRVWLLAPIFLMMAGCFSIPLYVISGKINWYTYRHFLPITDISVCYFSSCILYILNPFFILSSLFDEFPKSLYEAFVHMYGSNWNN